MNKNKLLFVLGLTGTAALVSIFAGFSNNVGIHVVVMRAITAGVLFSAIGFGFSFLWENGKPASLPVSKEEIGNVNAPFKEFIGGKIDLTLDREIPQGIPEDNRAAANIDGVRQGGGI